MKSLFFDSHMEEEKPLQEPYQWLYNFEENTIAPTPGKNH